MKFSVRFGFRIVFLIGLSITFISMFLDWYSFIAYDDQNNLIVSWTYHLFLDWQSFFSSTAIFNEGYKPRNSSIPILINVILILLLVITAYSVLFEDVEKKKDISKLYRYSYLNLCLLFLMGFFIVLFPVIYLIPNNLYYPWLYYIDLERELTFFYCIGPGYILLLFGFVCTFPYCIFYYRTAMKFEKAHQHPQKVIENYIEAIQEPLDLDKYIAEEELKQNLPNMNKNNEIEQLYSRFIKMRRIK